jgi:hypothetical protein
MSQIPEMCEGSSDFRARTVSRMSQVPELCDGVPGLGCSGWAADESRLSEQVTAAGSDSAPVVEMALAALDVPHGRGGVQAAIDWLAAEVR